MGQEMTPDDTRLLKNVDKLQQWQIYPPLILSVPRCRKQAWGRPCEFPARMTGGWCRGRWWSQHGSLLAEKTPWSQTSHTASALLHRASLHPHSGHCPPHSGISLVGAAMTGRKRMDTLNLYQSSQKMLAITLSDQTNSSLMKISLQKENKIYVDI